jgi:hypothetical protein
MIRMALLAASLALSACASGTAIATGTARPPTTADQVQIYLEPPANYEVIGLVTANSRTGFTPQQSLNYALAEIRDQAAALGGNGVLIDSAGQGSGGPIIGTVVGSTVIMTGGDHPNIQQVRGRAIFVSE